MINLIIFCIVCALLYAFRGGTIFVTEWERRLEWLTAQPNPTPEQRAEIAELEKRWWPKKLRKPIYCIVTGVVFALIAYFNASIDALNALISAIIVSLGSFLPPLTSPRPLFWMWQGVYRAEEVKPNILNGWMHWLAAKWGAGKPTIYGLIYGSCRGLFELPTTIALAVYYHNPIIALWGLLGGFMGLVYYASGKLVKEGATGVAEKAYGGLIRGLILTGVLTCLH